jgi:hypothetical protein
MDFSFCEEDFNKKALDIFDMSEILNDNWKIHKKNEKFYLTKSQLIRSQQSHSAVEEAVDDPSMMTTCGNEEIISIEYHVLFHPSYQVPALYFNAYLGELTFSLDLATS